MKRVIGTIFICLSLCSMPYAQELLVNGNFDDELEGWTYNPLMDGGVEGEVAIFDDGYGPSMGSGPYLWMFCEGTAYFNQCIWQAVTVQVGDTLIPDGAFMDLTDGGLENFWCEIFLGATEPVEDVDYVDNRLLAFNWWDGCCNNIDGTFLQDACQNFLTDSTYWVVPDSMGSGEITLYYMLKTGIWMDDGTERSLEIAIDSLSLMRVDGATAVDPDPAVRPAEFELYPNYPNPFNPATTIDYILPRNGYVEIEITDLLGRRLCTLVAEEVAAGPHKVTWDGLDDRGVPAASGMYLYTLKADGYSETRKLLLMR